MKKSNILLGVSIFVLATIAILVLFAPMFTYLEDYGAGWGSGFGVIFGTASGKSFHPVPLLILAFSCEIAAAVLALVAIPFGRKANMAINLLVSILLIASGILFLCSVSLFIGANTDNVELTKLLDGAKLRGDTAITLGAAPITNAIFAFVAGLIGIFGAYKSLQAN